MTSYFNKISGFILISTFFVLFILTVYSLISSNEVVRDAELIQYVFIADLIFLLILLVYLAIFLINYIKYKNRDVVGLRLFNKFFLFFGMFSIIPSGIILLSSAIFFNIELSTWLGPAFKSTVNNSYQLAQKYIDQTENNLVKDSKFIRNYVLAERLIDRDIIQRFNISTVYNIVNDEIFIEHFSNEETFLKEDILISLESEQNQIEIYSSLIIQTIQSAWRKPINIQDNLICDLRISVNKNGRVINANLIKSSGNIRFDNSALKAVERVETFNFFNKIPMNIYSSNFKNIVITFNPS